jgi:hypothetical protein
MSSFKRSICRTSISLQVSNKQWTWFVCKKRKICARDIHFDLRDNAIENYILGLALTNNKWLKTRVEHQLTAQTKKPARIPQKNYWYSIDLEDSHNE